VRMSVAYVMNRWLGECATELDRARRILEAVFASPA
jgi:hypothetical protein